MAKIYVASSWRNILQPAVVKLLLKHGHQVYDFRNPSPDQKGFSWSEIDPKWQSWTPYQYIQALSHPRAVEGYNLDLSGMMWSDVCVLLLPCGRSAHTEAGYMKGLGKKVYAVITEDNEAELMYRVFDKVFDNVADLVLFLNDELLNAEVSNG